MFGECAFCEEPFAGFASFGHGWIPVDDSQTANWAVVDESQTPNWIPIDDFQG